MELILTLIGYTVLLVISLSGFAAAAAVAVALFTARHR
jgi:hypothetical protein